MTWGPIIAAERPRTAEELEELEEQRAHGRTLRKLGYVLACALGVLALQQCAAMGDIVAKCDLGDELPAAHGG